MRLKDELAKIINNIFIETGSNPVEIQDNMDIFSDIGFTSLDTTELVLQIEQEIQITLGTDFFDESINSEAEQKSKFLDLVRHIADLKARKLITEFIYEGTSATPSSVVIGDDVTFSDLGLEMDTADFKDDDVLQLEIYLDKEFDGNSQEFSFNGDTKFGDAIADITNMVVAQPVSSLEPFMLQKSRIEVPSVRERFYDVVAGSFSVDPNTIETTDQLVETYGADSLALVGFGASLRDEFPEVSLLKGDICKTHNIGAALTFLEESVSNALVLAVK